MGTRARLIPWIATAVVVLAAGAIAVTGVANGAPGIKTAQATAVSSGRRVSAAGVVASERDVAVYSPLQSTVVRILVKDQQTVRNGDPLVVLDAEPFRVAKAQALAAIRQAEAVRRGTYRERVATSAALKAAKQAYSSATRDMARVVIKAPFDGTVFLSSATSAQALAPKLVVGQGVSPQVPLVRVVDLRSLKFVADVDQDDISVVSTGQAATVVLDPLPERRFPGAVTFVGLVSRATRSGVTAFAAEAALPAEAKDARVGMEGTVEIVVAQPRAGVRIPQQAVTRRDGQAVVFVVSGGTARLRRVTLGPSTGTDYEVTTGLSAGDVVATSGLAELRDGARVATR